METRLQNYLRDKKLFDPLKRLELDYGIYSKRHPSYPNLIQFCYDQIESQKVKNHPLVVESRGIILDEKNNYSVVACPFDRFFNYGEYEDDSFDFDSMRVQEKLDGSLMILYYYDNQWQVATKGSPDASGSVGEYEFTFAELFWIVFRKQFNTFLDTTYTYCFELESKYNRIVVNQEGNEGCLTLIGVRDNKTGASLDVSSFKNLCPVREFGLNKIDDVLEFCKTIDPTKQEGFVLVDKNYNRLKLKSPQYVLIHHLKDSLNEEKIVELLQKGEQSEVLSYFPDLKTKYDELQKLYNGLVEVLHKQWGELSSMTFETKKDFALFVQKPKYNLLKSAYFALYDKKVKNVNQWVGTCSPKKMLEYMKELT